MGDNKIKQSYNVDVLEVHSGDDLVLMVSLGLDSLYKKVRARLQGVDTPDAYKASTDTQAGEVRDKVRTLTKGKRCYIDVHTQSSGKSGWVVTLYLGPDNSHANLNEILRKDGYVF